MCILTHDGTPRGIAPWKGQSRLSVVLPSRPVPPCPLCRRRLCNPRRRRGFLTSVGIITRTVEPAGPFPMRAPKPHRLRVQSILFCFARARGDSIRAAALFAGLDQSVLYKWSAGGVGFGNKTGGSQWQKVRLARARIVEAMGKSAPSPERKPHGHDNPDHREVWQTDFRRRESKQRSRGRR